MIKLSNFKSFLHLTKRGVQIVAAVTLFKEKVGDLRWCEGASMLPTLNVTGDLLIQITICSIFNFNLNKQDPILSNTEKKNQQNNTIQKLTNRLNNKNNNIALQKNLNRGDLVNFISPLNPSVLACKRILALPGDKILIDLNHHLNFNPNNFDLLHENLSIHSDHIYNQKSLLTIPEGHLWLQGDNYAVSIDSRTYGPVPIALVTGKIVARVWPSFTWLSKPFKFQKVYDRNLINK